MSLYDSSDEITNIDPFPVVPSASRCREVVEISEVTEMPSPSWSWVPVRALGFVALLILTLAVARGCA